MRSLPLALALLGCGAAEPPGAEPAPEPSTVPPADTASCEPVNYFCGCRWECALVRRDGALWVRLDSEGEQQFTRDPAFEVCGAAGCVAGLVMPGTTCEETCGPSRAPMAGCRRVEGEASDATGVPCVPEP